jgi:hypothetical protein
MEHIPSRYFSHSIPFEEKWKIPSKYPESEYGYVRLFLSETQKITASAIKISKVIKKHFNLDLFPSIFTVATKAWDTGSGTAYFMMYGSNGQVYHFYDPASKFKAMNGKYSLENHEFYRDK